MSRTNGNKQILGDSIALSLLKNGFIARYDATSERLVVESPEVLSIYSEEYRPASIRFANIISELIYNYQLHENGIKLNLDFSKLSELSAASAVMLFGEITAIQLKINESDVITVTLPTSKGAKRAFSNYDFYRAIKPGTAKKLNSLFDDNCFFQSGTVPAKLAISAILSLNKIGLKFQRPETNLFVASIMEAMSNVRHHSYGDEVHDLDKRWWQFTYFDKEQSSLHFVVYDRGRGIPNSIRANSPNHMNEGELIAHAMTVGVTSKQESGRGKGSGEILKTFVKSDDSSLLIYSGKGVYYRDKEDGIKIVEEVPTPIKGAIIEWQVPYKEN